jgi:hypothetical protein
MADIVAAGWRVSLDQRGIRRYAIGAVVVLGVVVSAGVVLVAGAPPAGVAIGLLAPLLLTVLVAAGFRAAVFELAGDVHRDPPRVRDVLRRAAVRCSEVLVVSTRSVRDREPRTPFAAAIVVVNGVSADEGARTSRALVAHRWGSGTAITTGLLFGALFVLPVAICDALVAVAWPYLGVAQLPMLVLAIVITIVALVMTLALDAGLRGALLRMARGDETALPRDVSRLVVLPNAADSPVTRAYERAVVLIVVATIAIALLPRIPTPWFAGLVFAPTVIAALEMLRRAYRRSQSPRSV